MRNSFPRVDRVSADLDGWDADSGTNDMQNMWPKVEQVFEDKERGAFPNGKQRVSMNCGLISAPCGECFVPT